MLTTGASQRGKIKRREPMSQSMAEFDEAGFELTCRKIRMCLVRGEPEQAIKELAEFAKHPLAPPITYGTSVHEIGLCPQLSGILEHAGYLNYGALAQASSDELDAIPQMRKDFLLEIRQVLASLKKKPKP